MTSTGSGATDLDPVRVAEAAAYGGRWLAYQQRHLRVPGLTAAIRHRGELVLSAAQGLADAERSTPMTPAHAFRIASHSKTFTATLVAQLVEQGRLRYDDEVAGHLPSLGAAVGGCTVRELLAHAAGLHRDGVEADFWQLDAGFPDDAELDAQTRDSAVVLDRGSRFKYSNVGFALLGRVVEAVTGSSYADLVRTRICGPLALHSTGADLSPGDEQRMATGYSSQRFGLRRAPLPHVATGRYAAATGCWSTADDLSAFADAHCLGVPTLLSDRSKRLLQQRQWDVDGEDHGYALGFQVFDVCERRAVGHGGAFPGFITATRLDPQERLAAVVLTNAVDGPAADLATGLLKLVYAAHVTDGPQVATDADRFAGRLFSMWGAVDVVRLGSRLVAVDLDRVDPLDHLTVLRPVGDDELEIVATSGMRSLGERVRYERAADGGVQRVRFGAQLWWPWDAYRARAHSGADTAHTPD